MKTIIGPLGILLIDCNCTYLYYYFICLDLKVVYYFQQEGTSVHLGRTDCGSLQSLVGCYLVENNHMSDRFVV